LSKSEAETLGSGSQYHGKQEFGQRCQGLLLSKKGWIIKPLAEHFEVGAHTIPHWFQDWEKQGLVGLLRQKGQGRKAILGLDQPYQEVGRIQAELEVQLQMSNERVKRWLKKSFLLPPPR
jgi:transposase